MNRKELIESLSGLPTIQITYEAAVQHFGGQVEASMDALHQSAAKQAKDIPREDFKYLLVYKRAPDPESITDPKIFTRLLAANSQTWLKVIGGKFIDYQPIYVTPDKIMATYEQRARSICAQRLAAKAANIPEAGPEDGTDLEVPVQQPNGSLRGALSQWLQDHPSHDKRLASVAFVVLEQLLQSGE